MRVCRNSYIAPDPRLIIVRRRRPGLDESTAQDRAAGSACGFGRDFDRLRYYYQHRRCDAVKSPSKIVKVKIRLISSRGRVNDITRVPRRVIDCVYRVIYKTY